MAKSFEPVVATLTLEIEFPELPLDSEISEILDKLREYAGIKVAELTIHRIVKKSLI